MKGKLFTCKDCTEITLAEERENKYTLKLTLKMYSQQLIQNFRNRKKCIPQNPNELALELLPEKISRIVVDSRSV